MNYEWRDLAVALRSLNEVLAQVNEPQLASSIQRLATRFEAAGTADERRSAVIDGLAYFRGMNSLNDVVIVHDGKPNVAANSGLDERRRLVYELLIRDL